MEVDAENLLYLIEARSPIYNSKDKNHANNIVIEKLWDEIATEMECEVSECKSKWRSLRNSYCRHMRDERTKIPGVRGKRKKRWYLADAMSFLKDFINQNRSASSLDNPDVEEYIVDETFQANSPAILNESTQSSTSTAKNSPVTSKKCKFLVSEMVAGPMKVQSRTRDKSPENANSLLFKCMLSDYEKLSNRRKRSFRIHMVTKMNEMQEEDENEFEKFAQ